MRLHSAQHMLHDSAICACEGTLSYHQLYKQGMNLTMLSYHMASGV